MEIPIIGGNYKGRYIIVNPQKTINWFPVIDQNGGINHLSPTPGMIEFADLGSTAAVRSMIVSGSYLYAIAGNSLYRISRSGVVDSISGSIYSTLGPVYMAYDGTNIMVVDPGYGGYIWSGGILEEIADADFPIPSSLTFQDGYFIVSEEGTQKFWVSSVNDPTRWDSLDFASAEQAPDNLKRVFSHDQNIWLLGEDLTEVWYNSASTFPFSRIAGGSVPFGIGAPASIAHEGGNLFWLTSKKQVVQVIGVSPSIISTNSVEYEINRHPTVSDAIGYCYSQEGHSFYVLVLPSGNQTWVYDLMTNLWHQRRSYPTLIYGEQGRHRSNCYEYFNGKHLVGDYYDGKIYELSLGAYDDGGNALIRQRTTQIVSANRKRMFFNSMQLNAQVGTGLNTGQGLDPQIMLKWSDDRGKTWSHEHWRSIGKIGEYRKRIIWNKLGSSFDRVFDLTITDPVSCVINNAELNISAGA